MKKHLFLTALVLALVMSFSCGALAADIVSEEGNVNQYKVTEALQAYEGTDLWIGTMAEWIADGNKVYTNGGGIKTVLENGEAIHKDDIVIKNGDAAIVLAVGTRNPWGYPAGSILDAGYCVNGNAARDNVWAIELLMNRWDSWAPDNCGVVTFDIAEYDFDGNGTKEKAVKVSRIHNDKNPAKLNVEFNVVTYYSLGKVAGENVVYMFSEITNNDTEKSATPENDIAITNKGDDGAYMVNGTSTHIAGNYGNKDGQKFSTFVLDPEPTEEDWVAFCRDKGSVGYKELCRKITYAPGETHTVKHYVVIDDEASTKAVINVQNALEGYAADQLQTVTLKSAPGAVVVVEDTEKGKDLGWFVCDDKGEAKVTLPQGNYNAFVECAGYAPGEAVAITGDTVTVARGEKLVKVTLNLKDEAGKAVFGRVEIPNAYPTVRYCGDSVYLDYVTETDAKGVVDVYVAPGEFEAVVYGEGFWFYSDPVKVTGNTTKATDLVQNVTVKMVYDAPEGYLSGDLHHHANKNDAFADPADAIPSLMASGLDVGYITDHDFTVNNYKAYELAQAYGMEGYLPSEEITCSWAHFNVLPLTEASYEYFLDENQENHIMDQFGKLPDFVKQTHDKEAAITANHPWYDYGLFTNKDTAPGGYTDDYDTIELNACDTPANITKTILSAADLWTGFVTCEGSESFGVVNKPHYLVGGSDTHDVKYPGFADANYNNTKRSSSDYVSGKVRTFAYVGEIAENDVVANGLAFSNAVVEGNSFTTFGPILTADKLPGESYFNAEGKFELKVKVESLENIDDIIVMSNFAEDTYTNSVIGEVPYIKALSKEDVNAKTATLELSYTAKEIGWIAVLVVDEVGSIAITNPYWVGNTFEDVAHDAWYFHSVTSLAADGIVNGYKDGTFKPENNVTRAEFATMIYRALDGASAKAGNEVKFSDVDADFWAAEAIYALAAEGIVTGYPDGTFNPNGLITRAEMAVMIYRATGLDTAFGVEFTDVPASSWYYDAVMILGNLGIVNGMGDGTFAPNANATRAQSAQIIYNAF